ncbi:MAG TPA: NifU family protein [Ignavibacteriaceae bacterium]|nr:NifU family protein [Ignavibacteriaceae bacterium]
MREDILKALDSIRPFLQADNGDIELIEITEDLIVKVKFTGACDICPMSQMTLRAGVEKSLLKYVPGIRRVEAVT